MAGHTFATAINCMDGRVQEPVTQFLKWRCGVEYVDMITEPGPIRILAENTNRALLDSIKARLDISVGKHGSKHVAVVGHYDCAGNPVAEETQKEQIRASMKLIQSWGLDVTVIGLWVDEQWWVRELA